MSTEYVPITPCRILDTRDANAGAMGRNTSRVFQVTGTAGFTSQGGSATGCGVPPGARAVALSLTANGVGQGRLFSYPAGASRPNATSLTYYPGVKITGESTTKLASNGKIIIANISTKSVTVAGDVVGYYAEPIALSTDFYGSISYKSSQVVSVSRTVVGTYNVLFNTPLQGCVANVTTANSFVNGAGVWVNSTTLNVRMREFEDNQPSDIGFFLTVTC